MNRGWIIHKLCFIQTTLRKKKEKAKNERPSVYNEKVAHSIKMSSMSLEMNSLYRGIHYNEPKYLLPFLMSYCCLFLSLQVNICLIYKRKKMCGFTLRCLEAQCTQTLPIICGQHYFTCSEFLYVFVGLPALAHLSCQ